jgi:hypothetical protein
MGKSISAMGGRLIALDGFSPVRPMECDAVINVTGESGWVLRRFRFLNFSSEFLSDLDQFVVNDHEFVVVSDWLVR